MAHFPDANPAHQIFSVNGGGNRDDHMSRAVRCGGCISDLFPVAAGALQGCVLAPTLFSTCMDCILGRMPERSSCCASFGNLNISERYLEDTEMGTGCIVCSSPFAITIPLGF